MKKSVLAHIALISSNLIYAMNYTIAKGIMPDYLTPLAIIFCRGIGALILFFVVDSLFFREKIKKKDLFRIALCAVFGIALNQIMFFVGLNLTTTINSSIILTVVPVLVLIFSFFFLKEKIIFLNILGIIFGAAGAIMLILRSDNVSLTSNTMLGNFYNFINALSFALYVVLIKPVMEKYNNITILKWLYLFGFIFIAPFCIKPFIISDWQNIPVNIWLSLGYVVVITTVVSYTLYNYGLKILKPTLVSMYIYIQPVFATIFAILLGKDFLTLPMVFSAILIFTGVYLVSIKK